MAQARVKTFKSGNSTVVVLPQALGVGPGVGFVASNDGDGLRFDRERVSFAEMVARLERLPKPSSIEVRDTEEIPEPAGL